MKYYDLAKTTPTRGSNRYVKRYIVTVRRRRTGSWKIYLSMYGLLVSSIFLTKATFTHFTKQVHAEQVPVHLATEKLPVPMMQFPTTTPTAAPTPTPTIDPSTLNPDYETIRADIEQVFGAYYPVAMRLLSCENSGLVPDIKNVNTDQWSSTDWGVFQINDHWQNIGNPAFLTDYDINIRVAWRIFVNNGYRFGVPPSGGWTCGRTLGI